MLPIRTKSAGELLEEEVVELNRDSKLPLLRDYTITRRAPCLPAMSDRALYDIIVNITGASVRNEPDNIGGAISTEKTDSTEAAVRTEKTDSIGVAVRIEKTDSIGVAVKTEKPDSTEVADGTRAVNSTRSPMGMMILEGMAIAIIAGLHVVVSNNYFPTEAEAWLWRMACIGMCVCPLVVIVCAALSSSQTSYHVAIAKMLWHNHQVQYTFWQWAYQAAFYLYELAEVQALDAPENRKKVRKYFHLLILVTCLLLLGGYLACILYITVASYISLRNPPDGMFVTPRWGDYWPHL